MLFINYQVVGSIMLGLVLRECMLSSVVVRFVVFSGLRMRLFV